MKLNKTILTAVLSIGLLRFTDINEDIICSIESEKIKDEVENAIMNYKQGIIDQTEFENVITFNARKLDDLLI
ncbi:hypothetical protein JYU17_00705 [Flavobacteriaceae bacterium AH-315-O20]|nr:hypothetical protein [Flavobacteriaceae bacterium AH-315-O20]